MSITPQKRSALKHLVNTKFPLKEGDTPEFHLVNEGVTELTESFNADTEDLQYIAEDQATSVVKRYAPSISLSAVMVDNDPVNNWIRAVVNRLPVAQEADTEYIRFNILDKYTEGGENCYKAVRKKAVISVDSIGGSAGDNIEMSVNLSGKGDPTYGYVTVKGTGSSATFEFTEKADIFNTVSTTGEVVFTVQDSASKALEGASITLNKNTKETDAEGKTTFYVPEGTYPYEIGKDGYVGTVSNVKVTTEGKTLTEKLSNKSTL